MRKGKTKECRTTEKEESERGQKESERKKEKRGDSADKKAVVGQESNQIK